MNREVKMMIRLPVDVRDWFRSYAKRNDRSMNGQMVAILREIMDGQKENAPESEGSDALMQ